MFTLLSTIHGPGGQTILPGELAKKPMKALTSSSLEKRFNDLVKTPYLGRPRPDIQKDYRSIPEGKHIIFYRVTNDIIEIIGNPHASMDVESHLLREQ